MWVALTADEQKTLYRLIFSAIEVCDQAIVAIDVKNGMNCPQIIGIGCPLVIGGNVR